MVRALSGADLSVDRLGLNAVPALPEVTQGRDGARALGARGQPAHEAMVQALYLYLLLVQLSLELLRTTAARKTTVILYCSVVSVRPSY